MDRRCRRQLADAAEHGAQFGCLHDLAQFQDLRECFDERGGLDIVGQHALRDALSLDGTFVAHPAGDQHPGDVWPLVAHLREQHAAIQRHAHGGDDKVRG